MDEVEGIEVVNSPRREDIQEICEKMCAWERWEILKTEGKHAEKNFAKIDDKRDDSCKVEGKSL